ncbi:MAG TPA: KfrA protein, partial [Sulfitobacter sp.]|nr:KfrA protein [Sulfitobacter sp.]
GGGGGGRRGGGGGGGGRAVDGGPNEKSRPRRSGLSSNAREA